jgi:hypothetical protein
MLGNISELLQIYNLVLPSPNLQPRQVSRGSWTWSDAKVGHTLLTAVTLALVIHGVRLITLKATSLFANAINTYFWRIFAWFARWTEIARARRYGGKKVFALYCAAVSLRVMVGGTILTRSSHVTRMSRADGYGVVVRRHIAIGSTIMANHSWTPPLANLCLAHEAD